MHINWKTVASVAVKAVGTLVPQVQIVQDAADAVIAAGKPHPTNEELAAAAVSAVLDSIPAKFKTPRVLGAIESLNDDIVELHNALAEASAVGGE